VKKREGKRKKAGNSKGQGTRWGRGPRDQLEKRTIVRRSWGKGWNGKRSFQGQTKSATVDVHRRSSKKEGGGGGGTEGNNSKLQREGVNNLREKRE